MSMAQTANATVNRRLRRSKRETNIDAKRRRVWGNCAMAIGREIGWTDRTGKEEERRGWIDAS